MSMFYVSSLMNFYFLDILMHSELVRAHSLHDDTGRRTTAIADRSSAVLTNFQLVQQCDQYPAA
tara:strand:+ start:25506 stop:25697 length:192 start_codon:yes stop_codon:yes gene_type:complete